jgi:hypothetical protein
MQDLLTSGRIVDLILAFMVLEALGLIVLWRRSGHGVRPLPLLANLAAGGTLLLALRSALTGGSPGMLALFLLLSLVAHLADLACRWSRPPVTTRAQKP